ncbi:hypothetical protein [Kutzneria chonburiensis]|uniref:Uncharacterized protein n=1 Tax=Kutzneria chonburiensis TaxID=1483604 RepID=A0ABV6N389_9PSEU|nr:hypothetical protein [Kutzneria chonburiensis]
MEQPEDHAKVIQAFRDVQKMWHHELIGKSTVVEENGDTVTYQRLWFCDIFAAASFVSVFNLRDHATIEQPSESFNAAVNILVRIDDVAAKRVLFPFGENWEN